MTPGAGATPLDSPAALAAALCDSFAVREAGAARWVVDTPLSYDDGDGLPVMIEQADGRWLLTDLGMSVSHLFYEDFDYTPARFRNVTNLVAQAGAEIDDAHRVTLVLPGPPGPHDIGRFLQVVAQIAGVSRMAGEDADQQQYPRIVRQRLVQRLTEAQVIDYQESWTPPELTGKHGSYSVDMRIGGAGRPPVAFFACSTSERVGVSTATMSQIRRAGIDVQPLLAYRPDRVTSPAIGRFQDEVEDDRAVVRVGSPDDLTQLLPELRRRGVTV